MPPLHRNQSTVNGPSSLEIANANSAVNTFLGARRPAWLNDGYIPSRAPRSTLPPLPTSTAAPIHTQQSQSPSNVTIASRGSPVHVDVDTTEHAPRAISVLPSPAPTNEMSPATSLGVGSPDASSHIVHGHAGPTLAEATRRPNGPYTDSPTSPHYSGNLPVVGTEAGVHDSICADVSAPHTYLSVRTSGRTPSAPSLLSPTQASGLARPNASELHRSMVRESSIVRTGSKRNSQTLSTLGPAAKRVNSGSQSSSEVLRLETSRLVASVRMQVASWPSLLDHSSKTLRQRYGLLEDAADAEDWWFLILHCLFSQWHLNGAAFHEGLRSSGEVAKQVDESFQMLNSLLPGTDGLDSRHLQWFAKFPAGTAAQLQSVTTPRDFYEVMTFLRGFAAQWSSWPAKVAQRGYPPMVYELQRMHCPSPLMQTVIVSYCARCLGVLGSLPELLNDLTADREYEKLVLDGNVADESRSKSRCIRASRYREIVHKHRMTTAMLANTSRAPETSISLAPRTQQGSNWRQSTAEDGPTGLPFQLLSPPMQQQQQSQTQAQHSAHHGQQSGGGPQQLQNPWAYQLQQYHRHQPQQQWSSTGSASATMQAPRERQADHQFRAPLQEQESSQFQMRQGIFNAPVASTPITAIGTSSLSCTVMSPYPSPGLQTAYAPSNTLNTAAINSGPMMSTAQNQGTPPTQHSRDFNRSLNPVAAPIRSARPGTTQDQHTIAVPLPQTTFRVIPPTEYPDNTWNWTSLEPGMHLVRQRSPIREPWEPTNTRFYQFVAGYIVTKVLKPRVGLETIDFDIDDGIFGSLVAMQVRHGLERCLHWDGSRRVRLRICKYPENVADFEITGAPVTSTYWPENVYISMNGEHVQLRRKQHFRSDWPVELTGLVRRGNNTVVVSLPELSKGRHGIEKYLLMVEVIRVSSAGALKDLVFGDEHFTYERTKGDLQQRLTGASDDDIVIQDKHLSISVTDPFSSTLCITPVRSIHCKHTECFDLDNWLDTRQAKPSKRPGEPSKVDEWKCPICGGDARPHQLRIDNFFSEVSKKLLADGAGRTRMIRMDDQGNWSAVVEQDDSDDDDEQPIAAAASEDLQAARGRSRLAPAVIVLDDDE